MDAWLRAALDYVPRWIDFQVQHVDQPGCSIAIAHKGEVVLEEAFGTADLSTGEALTSRHRFRVASHSKTSPFPALGMRMDKPKAMQFATSIPPFLRSRAPSSPQPRTAKTKVAVAR